MDEMQNPSDPADQRGTAIDLQDDLGIAWRQLVEQAGLPIPAYPLLNIAKPGLHRVGRLTHRLRLSRSARA